MTPEVERKRREIFEDLFPVPYYVMWNTDRKGYYSINRDSTRKRGSENYDAKWTGFNAALDAVEIVLPAPEGPEHYGVTIKEDPEQYEQLEERMGAQYAAIFKCEKAIESTGLGLRVK